MSNFNTAPGSTDPGEPGPFDLGSELDSVAVDELGSRVANAARRVDWRLSDDLEQDTWERILKTRGRYPLSDLARMAPTIASRIRIDMARTAEARWTTVGLPDLEVENVRGIDSTEEAAVRADVAAAAKSWTSEQRSIAQAIMRGEALQDVAQDNNLTRDQLYRRLVALRPSFPGYDRSPE